MKSLKSLLAVTLFLVLIISCQKELTLDTDGNSIGTLKSDITGGCLPSYVNGVYAKDTALNSTNYINVQVNVTTVGKFFITSDTINGYYFTSLPDQQFGNIGLNTVRLYGKGNPIAAGNNTFTVKYGTSQCTIDVNVVGPGAGAAVYSLSGAPGTCSGAVVGGAYTAGTALAASNTVVLQVSVSSIGTYNLAAASVNGMIFTGTGVFASTGLQNVTLAGSGIPLIAGIFNVTATNGTSSCTFSITVLPAGTGTAIYSLNGSPATCSGAVINGIYTVGTALTIANTVVLQVTVLTAGTYTISTNTVNGISFSATGTFIAAGPQPVILTGAGTPAVAGNFNFTATAGVSTCTFTVTCVTGGGGATYTLNGAPGACSGAVVNGMYITGVAVTAANTVSLGVNVTGLGTYTISTNTNNGLTFSKSGSFIALGPQTVILDAAGTPPGTGSFNYTATGGTSTCTFTVTVVNNDYFPLTQNSWWSYNSTGYAPDSLYKKATTIASVNSNNYRKMDYGNGTMVDGNYFFRKSVSDYYEYLGVDSFSSNYSFQTYQMGDLLFLKESSPAATTWMSPEFIGVDLGTGFPLKLQYSFTITSTGGTQTINGVTYNNVTLVSWKCMANLNNTGYVDDALLESYYSKGVGLILFKFKDAASAVWTYQDDMRFYQVL